MSTKKKKPPINTNKKQGGHNYNSIVENFYDSLIDILYNVWIIFLIKYTTQFFPWHKVSRNNMEYQDYTLCR